MTVRMAEMTWCDYARRVDEGQPVLLPVGSIEQHGFHMPLSVDVIIPLALASEVARRVGAIVAEPFAYGYKSQPRSGGGQSFRGTTSLDGATLTALMRDLLREFARHGVRRVALIDGHFENAMFLIEGVDLALRDLAAQGVHDMKVARIDYWEFITLEAQAATFDEGFPGWALEHASIMETSMMLHLRPDLVDLSQVVEDGPAKLALWDAYPLPDGTVPSSGVLSTTRGATAAKGRMLFDVYTAGVERAVRESFAL
ncbi:creatininase [Terrarubrum flagellatum]|uniref:creatininase n=1 Tax=Terrirubrum flagellatum TaxID=2895980 RepID=UPI0031451459